jgi:serine protease Do
VNTGEVSRGFLGVAPQTLTPELATQFGTPRGALVAEITPGSAAEKAGLRAGDIITKVNELEIRDPRQLLLTVSQFAPGTSVRIEYMRDGKTATATAKLERRPEHAFAGGPGRRRADSDDGVLDGVAVADISPQMREQLQIPSRVQGAIITEIDPTSPSDRQGLREGDVILELDRKPIKSAQEAVQLSSEIKGPNVMVRVWREGQSQFVVIDESTE